MINTTRSFFVLLSVLALCSTQAQPFTYPATGVTTTAGEFTATCPVTNLNYNITPGVRSSTPFAYETTGQFNSPDVGYIAAFNNFTGTLGFDLSAPVTVDRVYLWNAYFTIELDHAVETTVFHFLDQNSALLASVTHSWPFPDGTIQTGDSVMLPNAVNGVMHVNVEVQTLHGGNDISLRRIAFAGPTLITGMEALDHVPLQAFPNPATDRVTLLVGDVRDVQLRDAAGRVVQAPWNRSGDRVEVDLAQLAAGRYHARITTSAGYRNVPLVVTR